MIKKQTKIRRSAAFFALVSMATALMPVRGQDIVTSEDFTGGSSAFVFSSSRKTNQRKSVVKSTASVRRTKVAKTETTRRITRQNVTVAKVAPKRTKAAQVDPATVKLDSVEFKRKTKEETSVIFAGVGEYYITNGQIEKAVEFFREAVLLDERNVNAKLGLSEALTRKGDEQLNLEQYEVAKLFYEDALRNNPKNAFAFAGLAGIAVAREDNDAALANYEKALSFDADLTEIFAPLGVMYYQKGEIAKSEEMLQKAIALDANNGETQFFIGLVRYRQNNNAEALVHLRRAIELDPKNAEAQYYIGEVYDRLDRDRDAIAAYRQAVAIDPRYVDAWFDLAAALYNRATDQGPNSTYYEEAVKAYREVVKLRPAYGEAHYNLGDVYRQMKRFDEAIASYRQALNYIKDDPEIYSKLGFVAGLRATNPVYQNFWRASIENLDKAASMNPNYINLSNLGWALYNAAQTDLRDRREADYRNKLERAKAALEKAVALDAKNSAPFLNLGMVLTDLGDFNGAIDALKKGTELQKNWLPAINELGIAYRKAGDFDNAVKQFRKAIGIDDNFAAAHYNLAEVEYRRGNLKEAKKEYEKLKKMNQPGLVQTLERVTNGGITTIK